MRRPKKVGKSGVVVFFLLIVFVIIRAIRGRLFFSW